MANRKPTDKQKVFINARAKGIGRNQSAIIAEVHPTKTENSPTVKEELARIREETRLNTGVTKEDVVRMLMDAANLAQIQGDATGLVAAARELGKMLGFYAPEVKKTLLGFDQATLKKALQDMGEEELLRIAYANTKTLEGEARLIEEK